MMGPAESYMKIGRAYKAMHAHEIHENALSTNKPWITAEGGKRPKRDSPDHTPIEGDYPETFASLSARTLHNVAVVLCTRQYRMEQGSRDVQAPVGSIEHKALKKAVLAEVDVPAIEVAFLFGFTSTDPVREMRIGDGKDPNTGRPVQYHDQPLTSRKRAT